MLSGAGERPPERAKLLIYFPSLFFYIYILLPEISIGDRILYMLVNVIFQREEIILCPMIELESIDEWISFDVHYNFEMPPL